jgi:tRNA nucleotidyltransferase (CCA-adding enzyme)
MKVYQVGGAVRDALLGEPVKERDWVVVGATPNDLLERGFKQVGKDFPVFLHPETGEEYALARTEKKSAPGHKGFEVLASPTVTLEQDLGRRDLTVNAIARDSNDELIDPFGGLDDLKDRVLRHVSDAFQEDPLRVLRVARFAAQLRHHEFSIAAATLALMARISASGELEALSPSRVWQETEKALTTERPDVFFSVLRDCGALARLYPEVDRLFGIPQPARWHPEIDTGIHTLMALRMAAELSAETSVRFAVLTHDLGKGTTPRAILPSHHGHGKRSVELIRQLGERLPVPKRYIELAVEVARHHDAVHRAGELSSKKLLDLLLALDAIRRPERWEDFLTACEADARGRLGLESEPYPQADRLRVARRAAGDVSSQDVSDKNRLSGAALGEAIRRERLRAIETALSHPPP